MYEEDREDLAMYVRGANDNKFRQVEHVTSVKNRHSSYIGESRRGGALYRMQIHTETGLFETTINQDRIVRRPTGRR